MSHSSSAAIVAGLLLAATAPASAQTYRSDAVEPTTNRTVRILQTNAASDLIHVIDPRTNAIEGVIDGIPRSHGVALHADGTHYFISNEHDESLDVVDSRTLELVKRIPLAAYPNNVAASNLSRKIYVAIMGAPLVQVVDMDTREVVRDIEVPGNVHNTFVTPDGRFAVAGQIGARTMSVIDTSTDEVVWEVEFDQGVRPISFETNPDGSTKRAFVQISGWHGVYVVDWATRRQVDRFLMPAVPVSELEVDGTQSAPSHGSVVLPDQSALWISSRVTASVYGYSLPDLEYIGRVHVGSPDWITASPDSRYIYIGVASENVTSVVDVDRMAEVARIPVGQVPKRVYTAIFPEGWSFPRESGND